MSLIRYQSPEVMAWPPLDRWSSLRDDLNSLFELSFWSSFARQGQLFGGWSPALDLYQDKDNVVAVVELPGMIIEGRALTRREGKMPIGGDRKGKTSNGEKAERTERYIGKFRRSITLPTRVDADKISATYRDGILTVTLPKVDEAKP